MKQVITEKETRFMRKGTLIRSKLMEYLPVMIMTNVSVFLLTTVDSIVAGNLVSPEAMASINIFFPAMVAVSVISTVVDSGSGTCLSVSMGTNDPETILRAKSAVKRIMILAALFVAVVEYPIIRGIIESYELTPEIRDMTLEYAKGIMIALPVGVISSVGSYQLQVIGKMRVLMNLSIMEGIANLVLDVFFVEAMDLGVAGIGFGTACANLLRCSVTVFYLAKKTDVYKTEGSKARWAETKTILFSGLPDAASTFMVAWQNYFIMRIVLDAFGETGGMIKGVCFFTLSLANMMILGLQKSMRPLLGLYSGAGDVNGVRLLMRNCMLICSSLVGMVIIAVEVFPHLMYWMNGVKTVSDAGILSLRLFALHFLFKGRNDLFRPYFANRNDSIVATVMIVVGNAMLPLFAKVLSVFFPAPFIWLSYLMTELLLLLLCQSRYYMWMKKDKEEAEKSEKKTMYMEVKPEEAIEASLMIKEFAEDNDLGKGIAYKMSLSMEEMVAYAVKSQDKDDIQIQVMVQFMPEGGNFFMMDDGKCIALNEDVEKKKLITDNYGLLKGLAYSVEYQYVLDMNYTVLRFSDNPADQCG